MFRETTIETYNVLDPEWDEVSRIIDFGNCWDDDKPTGDYAIFPSLHLLRERAWHKPHMRALRKPNLSPLFEERKPKPEPQLKPQPVIPDRNKILWWRHEMQEISEEVLARIYNLEPAALREAIQDEWAVIYEFWGGTPEEFRAEMRRPENIDKRRA
jgi:hypothetical protein